MINEIKKHNFDAKQKQAELKLIIQNLSQKEKFKIWIRTLLCSMKVFPEIIKTIDKIIELQASTISFMSDVFSRSGSALNQAEQIINLSERKNSILNIYIMLQNLLKETSEDEQEFLNKKFLHKFTIEELAEEYGISQRSVYRRIEKIIDELQKKCASKNWTLRFIESQIKDEGWLIQKFNQNLIDYAKSSGFAKEMGE